MHYQLQKWKDILSTSKKQLKSLPTLTATPKDIEVLKKYYKQRIRFACGRIEALQFRNETNLLQQCAVHHINVVDDTIL